MTADIKSNKKLSSVVTELFLKGGKLNISVFFTSQCYLIAPKTIRLNSTHYFITKIHNKKELQQVSSNYFPEIDFNINMN